MTTYNFTYSQLFDRYKLLLIYEIKKSSIDHIIMIKESFPFWCLTEIQCMVMKDNNLFKSLTS